MVLRNLIFQLEVIKQRLLAGFASHHEQASKANREQQHRVLWPAYNPNLATRQASTEGLFQQTQALALKTPAPSHFECYGDFSTIELSWRLQRALRNRWKLLYKTCATPSVVYGAVARLRSPQFFL